MSTAKPAIIAGIAGVGITIGMFILCANSHIDFFPCTQTVRDHSSSADMWRSDAPLVTRDGTCSLMDHLRDDAIESGEKSELTGAGWALLIAFCVSIGVADTMLTYTLLSRVATLKKAA